MISLKIRQSFFNIFFSIQNDEKIIKDILTKLSIEENGKRVLSVEDPIRKNLCLITYSEGMDTFKIEHWGGIENTALNINKTPELVLTTFIQNKEGLIEQIKNSIIKSFSYDTIYSQWINAGNKTKIQAYLSEHKELKDLHETEVIVKNQQDNTYLVTNSRNQAIIIDHENFYKQFEIQPN